MGYTSIKPLYLITLIIAVLALLGAFGLKYFTSSPIPKITTTSNTPTPTPTVTKSRIILPSGEQIYTFSHGDLVVGPKIKTATINSLVPNTGDTQTISVVIKHNSPVTSAQATVNMDNFSQTYPLKLVTGTSSDGTWEGSWPVESTYETQYSIKFKLTSDTGDYNGGLTFR